MDKEEHNCVMVHPTQSSNGGQTSHKVLLSSGLLRLLVTGLFGGEYQKFAFNGFEVLSFLCQCTGFLQGYNFSSSISVLSALLYIICPFFPIKT